MSLSTAKQIDELIAAHTADVRHSHPRIHIAAASSSSPVLYRALGGTSHLPPLGGASEDAPPLKVDDTFWMASATKLVTTVAVLQLVEQGLWELETDVRAILPELNAAKRLNGFDEAGEPILVENDVPITVHQLITHTCGFAYEWSSPEGQQAKYRQLKGIKAQLDPTSDRSSVTGIPLDFKPGERRMYGPGLDWAGFALEKLTGLSLEEYFQQNIFKPLGITDISFFHKEDHVNMAYRKDPLPAKTVFVPGAPIHLAPSYNLGGGGLYGSASSYLVFLRSLLPNSPGPKLLGKELSKEMFEPQLRTDQQRVDTQADCQYDLHPWARDDMPNPQVGLDWGYGGTLSGTELASGRKKGSLCWSGLAGTYWVIDPASDLVFLVWTNILPFGDQSTFDLWKQVEPLIYAGLPSVVNV